MCLHTCCGLRAPANGNGKARYREMEKIKIFITTKLLLLKNGFSMLPRLKDNKSRNAFIDIYNAAFKMIDGLL